MVHCVGLLGGGLG